MKCSRLNCFQHEIGSQLCVCVCVYLPKIKGCCLKMYLSILLMLSHLSSRVLTHPFARFNSRPAHQYKYYPHSHHLCAQPTNTNNSRAYAMNSSISPDEWEIEKKREQVNRNTNNYLIEWFLFIGNSKLWLSFTNALWNETKKVDCLLVYFHTSIIFYFSLKERWEFLVSLRQFGFDLDLQQWLHKRERKHTFFFFFRYFSNCKSN